jgi:mono/diheme cytochrome c family protein
MAAIPATADDEDPQVERGRYLTHAGGCITCHTEDRDDAVPLAGGRALESPFGTFYAPNITPDPETGIGEWSNTEFVRAFQAGLNPKGDAYFPAFPYTSYTGMSNEDLLAIKAYLFSLEPVKKENRKHDLPIMMSSRKAAGVWKSRYFKPQRFLAVRNKDEQWNRGAYLVRHLGHCGECHTPRGGLGELESDLELAGNPEGPGDEEMPNITPHEDGIGDWSIEDIERFLDTGMLPNGDYTDDSMADVIKDNTSHLSREDRLAIATYLKSLPPLSPADRSPRRRVRRR